MTHDTCPLAMKTVQDDIVLRSTLRSSVTIEAFPYDISLILIAIDSMIEEVRRIYRDEATYNMMAASLISVANQLRRQMLPY